MVVKLVIDDINVWINIEITTINVELISNLF